MNYKKGILIFAVIIFVNFLLTASLFAGAYCFAVKTYESKTKLIEEGKEKAFYIYTKLSKKFMDETDALRIEDPVIIASQNSYDVYNYDLSISFDMNGKKIDGVCYITAKSLTDTLSIIYINFYDNMNVSNVAFINTTRLSSTYEDVRDIPNWQEVEYKRINNHLVIDAKGKFSKDEQFVVKISYSGTPLSKGFDSFSFKDIYNSRIAYTLSEPNYAPVWWPCKDLPDDKALQNMRLTVPTGHKGVSNGLLTDTVQNADGTTTFNWKSNYPISTYLVSVVAAKFSYWFDTYTSLDGTKSMPVVYYAFPRDSAKAFYDWQRTPEMIKVYSKTFGEYPFIDEKYGMAQFGWTSGAMEHQTLTSMGYLLVTGDRRYEEIVAHELAHHWFGDAVTLETWDDIWLNEGFATYSEAIWVEYDKGKQAYLDYLRNNDYGYFSGTIYAPEGGIDNPSVYATVYQKGGWVLHMLRGVLGDEVFFKSIQTYFERYKYKNANTKQLVEVIEEVSGKKLDWFFDQWVYKGTGRPKYEYSWRFEDFQGQENSGKHTVHLEIKQVQTDYDVYKMPIKIRVLTDAGDKDFTVFNDTKDQSFLLTVDSKPKEVKLDPDGWILKKIAKGTYK